MIEMGACGVAWFKSPAQLMRKGASQPNYTTLTSFGTRMDRAPAKAIGDLLLLLPPPFVRCLCVLPLPRAGVCCVRPVCARSPPGSACGDLAALALAGDRCCCCWCCCRGGRNRAPLEPAAARGDAVFFNGLVRTPGLGMRSRGLGRPVTPPLASPVARCCVSLACSRSARGLRRRDLPCLRSCNCFMTVSSCTRCCMLLGSTSGDTAPCR